jgi:uncharacterized membrane protein YkvA (DUF1232 family)
MAKNPIDDALVGEILEPVSPDEEAGREERVRRNFWRTVKRAARQVPFMEEVVASYFAALDKRTPARVRGTLLAALAYFVLPLDFVPDFLAGLGFTDDIAVLTAALTAIRGHIKPAHRKAAREALDDEPASRKRRGRA